MVNLLSELLDLDKKKIENYILIYGNIHKDAFCGVDEWLYHWSKSKVKLYHLLGNQFQYKFPISVKKSEKDITEELKTLVYDHAFGRTFEAILNREFFDNMNYTYTDYCQVRDAILSVDALRDNKVTQLNRVIKIKDESNDKKKSLQISNGTKTLRLIKSMIDFWCPEDEEVQSLFEDFRIQHSMIFNEKDIKGTAVISIHPLDFMTMSDTTSWTSCMSWADCGCYNIGSVEMMNSNNVLCCYIENHKPLNFNSFALSSLKNAQKYKTLEDASETGFYKNFYKYAPQEIKDDFLKNKAEYAWADKKFRCLAITTKDIIISGRNYPYSNNEIAQIFVKKIKELAETNMNWHYQYGIEQYQDMKHMWKSYLYQNQDWIRCGNTTKHNILLNTEVMYNDFYGGRAGNDRLFWAYRNKVKHNVVLQISGKVGCLCCGHNGNARGEKVYDSYDDSDDYEQTSGFICQECVDESRRNCQCRFCSNSPIKIGKENLFKIPSSILKRSKEAEVYDGAVVCSECIPYNFFICPCCNKPYIQYRHFDIRITKNNSDNGWGGHDYQAIEMCQLCKENFFKNPVLEGIFFKKEIRNSWYSNYTIYNIYVDDREYKEILEGNNPLSKYTRTKIKNATLDDFKED